MLKVFLAIYHSSFVEDKPKQSKIKAHSVDQAQAIAELNVPQDYRLVCIYEPHEVRPPASTPVYKEEDCFSRLCSDGTKEIFKIKKITERLVYLEVCTTFEGLVPEGKGIGKKQFESRWYRKFEDPPKPLTSIEYNKLKTRYSNRVKKLGHSHW